MKKENAQIGFSLQGIKTEQYAIFEEDYNPKKEIGLGTELQFKLDQNSRQIGVVLGFEFVHGKKVFLKIQVSCHFQVEEKSWSTFIKEKGRKIVVPKGFLAHVGAITTGTARGILFAKTEGTQFSKFILPTLNVAEMVPNDYSFDAITE